MNEIPEIECWDTGKHWTFFCRHCQRWHFHDRHAGRNPHKAAHCDSLASPYTATGYTLQCQGQATPDIQRALKEQDAWQRAHNAPLKVKK